VVDDEDENEETEEVEHELDDKTEVELRADDNTGEVLLGADDETELDEPDVELGAEELVAVILVMEELEEAARLLYIWRAFEPPQYSSAFPLQVMIQAADPTTLPALGEFPQKPT
jgi:hypothetical protein